MGRLTVPEWQSVETSGSLAGEVMAALSRAKRAASGLDVLPLVVAGDAVVIDRATFIDWFGGVEVSNTIKGMAKEIGMRLGDVYDDGFQDLVGLLNVLTEAAHAGDASAFRAAFRKLKAAIDEAELQSTGEFVDVGANKLSTSQVSAIKKSLVAAKVLLQANKNAVKKGNFTREAYMQSGVLHDSLVAGVLGEVTSDLLSAGLDSQKALEMVVKSAGVDVRELCDANARHSAGQSEMYWGWRWDNDKK